MSDLAISAVSGRMLPSWASSNGLIRSGSRLRMLRASDARRMRPWGTKEQKWSKRGSRRSAKRADGQAKNGGEVCAPSDRSDLVERGLRKDVDVRPRFLVHSTEGVPSKAPRVSHRGQLASLAGPDRSAAHSSKWRRSGGTHADSSSPVFWAFASLRRNWTSETIRQSAVSNSVRGRHEAGGRWYGSAGEREGGLRGVEPSVESGRVDSSRPPREGRDEGTYPRRGSAARRPLGS
jgi:hypothetical protein